MFETEALQLYLQSPSLQQIAGGADPHADDLDRTAQKALLDQLAQTRSASSTIREFATNLSKKI
jgi:hypothetical protein